VEDSSISLGAQDSSFDFKAPIGMVNNIYDACQLLAGMLPAPKLRTHLKRNIDLLIK
jgi:hypothetical protein